MFIVRLPNRDGKLHLALGAEGDTRASYPEIHRTKRIIGRNSGFPMREVEGTGRYRHDTLTLRLGRDTCENEFGRAPYQREVRVSLAGAESDKTVRRLPNEMAEPLALNATAIERATDEVHRLRSERAEMVRAAWKKAAKSVGASELEKLAERTKEVGPEKPRELTDDEKAALKRDTELLNAFTRRVLSRR